MYRTKIGTGAHQETSRGGPLSGDCLLGTAVVICGKHVAKPGTGSTVHGILKLEVLFKALYAWSVNAVSRFLKTRVHAAFRSELNERSFPLTSWHLWTD